MHGLNPMNGNDTATSRRSPVRTITAGLAKSAAVIVLVAFILLIGWAFWSRKMPALHPWHTTHLSAEFTAKDASGQFTLHDYLEREDELFRQLEASIVYESTDPAGVHALSRYRAGGSQNAGTWPRDWNRTFELVPDEIRGGALLLHGLTDSPYSLRRVGELLLSKGFYVLGLRLPGHGTIPEALTRVRSEDWVAASRIGARQVRERIGPDLPFVVAGYSNGGALSIKYALDGLFDPALPRPQRLLLFSPEIGIAPVALVADSHELLSFLPFFAKFAWLSIEPEYDPFKYNSFPKNAAQQAWDLTHQIHRQIDRAAGAGTLSNFPPVLTFLSWTDATVDTSATIHRLYDRFENSKSELVVFDVNRSHDLAVFLPMTTDAALESLEARTDLPYRLTVITNTSPSSRQVAERTRRPDGNDTVTTPLALEWPSGVYSLAHVAVPFAPDDPVYGTNSSTEHAYDGLPLGALHPHGETNVLTVAMNQLMRLRHNPFFSYLERRVLDATDEVLASPRTTAPAPHP